jgi:anti-anti-sigma regulatory factor
MATFALENSVMIPVEQDGSSSYRRALADRVQTEIREGHRQIVLDCSNWKELDLLLLSAVVKCADTCSQMRADFELANLKPTLKSVVDALHLSKRLNLA